MPDIVFEGGSQHGKRQAVSQLPLRIQAAYMKPVPIWVPPPPRPRWWRHPLRWHRWKPPDLPPMPEMRQLAYRRTSETRDGARVYEIDGDWPWFKGPEIDEASDLYPALATAACAVDPMVRRDTETRWVMDLGWYKRIRATAVAGGRDDPDGDDPEKWKPSPQDMLMGIRINVRDDGGKPHLENRRYPADYGA